MRLIRFNISPQVGLGLLMVIFGLFVYALRFQYNEPRITVKAQLVDADVIKKPSISHQNNLSQELMIQYVYQYQWNQQAYISRDMVHCTINNHQNLTSHEWRLVILSDYLKANANFNIWLNPNNPNDSIVQPPFRN